MELFGPIFLPGEFYQNLDVDQDAVAESPVEVHYT
jgi:hypothetical protein